jgi:hypothetical protein
MNGRDNINALPDENMLYTALILKDVADCCGLDIIIEKGGVNDHQYYVR